MNIKMKSERKFFALMVAWTVVIGVYGLVVESPFLLTLAGYTSVLALFALGINVMLGGVGEVPLGQCLFYGIGAYGVGICMKNLGLSFESGLLVGILCSIILALVIGALTLRLTGA